MNLASLPLGMAVAAMGAWFAIQGGLIIYLPIGSVILLAGLRPVLAASSKASVTPEWTKGSNMAPHLRQQNS